MKQLVQNYLGKVAVKEVPVPALGSRGLLVRNAYSAISPGTERTVLEQGGGTSPAHLLERTDLWRKLWEALKRQGLQQTYQRIEEKLRQWTPLGYSCAGTVLAVGEEVAEFAPGDAVACGGAGYASHADIAFVPASLCVRIPEGVGLEEAAFTTLGAIALQGVRQAEAGVGDRVGVVGLGLVGLLSAQVLQSAGARVLGVDLRQERLDLARQLGLQATRPEEATGLVYGDGSGLGLDRILITAKSPDNQSLILAGALSRDRGRIVIVGSVKMELPRTPYYEKELEVRLSRSYGPGRYDREYEEKGHDYPVGYVRWTEKRNMEAFLGLVAQGKVRIRPLITHRFPIDRAEEAYDLLLGRHPAPTLGIVLDYPSAGEAEKRRIEVRPAARAMHAERKVRLGFVGAGHFSCRTLLPLLRAERNVQLEGVCNASSLSSRRVAERFGFRYCTSSTDEILADPAINTVFIATRHGPHAPLVCRALQAGKAVFVEKPLALNADQLQSIVEAYERNPAVFMVGFNRRFAPSVQPVLSLFEGVRHRLMITYRVNAESLPVQHWMYDPEEGGGRIVGEVCHFVDLIQYLCGARVVSVSARALSPPQDHISRVEDLEVSLQIANGSLATIVYTGSGSPKLEKERIEVFGGSRAAVVDNFVSVQAYTGERLRKLRLPGKGHQEEIQHFLDCVSRGQEPTLTFSDCVHATQVTFAILGSLRQRQTVLVP